jgi:GT2 family glycosyltransferase
MDVDWVSGAAMLVRREALEQTGLMNEDFFLYGEDVEWCWRMKKAGWRIRYLPCASVGHYSGQSTKKQEENLLMSSARWLENITAASNTTTPLWALKTIVYLGLVGRLTGHGLAFLATRNRLQWEHVKAGWKQLFLV